MEWPAIDQTEDEITFSKKEPGTRLSEEKSAVLRHLRSSLRSGPKHAQQLPENLLRTRLFDQNEKRDH